MKRVQIMPFAALGLCLTPICASAQSVDIPLNYAINTGSNYGVPTVNSILILTINVGVNGEAAQPYAFDTGSAVFLAPNGTFAGGTSSVLASGVNIDTYAGSSTYAGNVYQVSMSSLKFYATPGATAGGISLGTSGSYNAASYTSLNGAAPPARSFGTAAVGVFGADAQAFTVGGTNVGLGGIFGQTTLPNTTAGYIVSANGQSLSALNSQLGVSIPGGPAGGQSIQTVPQSITACNPCVTVGLTPALLAQFMPLNTVHAAASGNLFPNSGTQGIAKFVPFNFTLNARSGASEHFSRNVSLDTGWTGFTLRHSSNFSDPSLTIGAQDGGTQETFNTGSANGQPSPYRLSNTTDSNFIGIGFFEKNSVLFDLAGQLVGYTPNFVTDANVFTAQPLVIDSSSVPLGLAGIISGSGGISIGAGGSATLSGSNTYTGPTAISGAGAYLALVGPGTISASSDVNVSAGGVFDISGTTSGVTIKSLSGDSNGGIWLGANSLVLSNANGTFGGEIAGSGGLTLTGGLEKLTGTNTYTGATTINGGILEVDGEIAGSSNVLVTAGGALAGSGIVDPLTVTIGSGAILAPGAPGSPGTSLTIDGNLVFQPGALYTIAVSPTAASSTHINGTATLGGATVALAASAPAYGKYSGATYKIADATNISGTFNPSVTLGTTISAQKFFYDGSASLSYDASNVYLSLPNYAVGLQVPSNAPINARNVADAFNASLLSGAPIPAGFQNLTNLSGNALNTAVNQLGGQPGGAAVTTGFMGDSSFLNMVLDPFVNGRDGGFGVDASNTVALNESATPIIAAPALAYSDDPVTGRANKAFQALWPVHKGPPVFQPHLTLWDGSYGGVGAITGNATTGAGATQSQIYGVVAGLDDHIAPDTMIGFALGGGGTSWQLNQGLGSGHAGMAQASVYGSQHYGPAYISGALAYSWQGVTTNRVVTLAGSDTLSADFGTNVVSSRLEAGYRLPAHLLPGLPASIALTPYGAVQAQAMFLPTYGEYAASGSNQFALNYAARDYSTVRIELGSWFDTDLAIAALPFTQSGALKAYGRVAWAHDFNNESTAVSFFQTLPGQSFLINTAKPAADSALVTAGFEYRLGGGWSIMTKFDGEYSATTSIFAGTGAIRKVW